MAAGLFIDVLPLREVDWEGVRRGSVGKEGWRERARSKERSELTGLVNHMIPSGSHKLKTLSESLFSHIPVRTSSVNHKHPSIMEKSSLSFQI